MTDGPKAVSIMMGTGGMAIGIETAGIHTLGFLEPNAWWGWPTRENLPDRIHTTHPEEWDAALDLMLKQDVDIVYGNPPCQGLSGANRSASADHPKNDMFIQALDVAMKIEPRVIMFENIPRMLGLGRRIVDQMYETADRHGYRMHPHHHRAGDFGVCQKRARVMFVFERIGEELTWPSHSLREPATVWEAISDLYGMSPNGDGRSMKYRGKPKSEYQETLRGDCMGVMNHQWLGVPDHHAEISPGMSWADMPLEWMTDKERDRVENGRIFNAALPYRLMEDRFAPTLTGMFNKMHPTKTRLISVREAARIMGFPDWWVWPSSSNFQQMAAGVCPPVMKYFGDVIMANLADRPMPVPAGHLF